MDRNYYDVSLDVIKKAIDSINPDAYDQLIEECVQVLKNGGKIVATGLGKNVPICEKFVGTMNSMGMDARFLHTNTAVHGDLGVVKPKDLVLLLSKSGNTSESVDLAHHLLDRGTDTWLITYTSSDCKLARILSKQLIMYLENEGDVWDIIPNNSTSVYLILLQGIALEIAAEMNIQLEDFKINHPGGGIGAKLRGES